MNHPHNPFIQSPLLPVDVVFHPSWWHKHTGITFDEDFFYHPLKRVESERRMAQELHRRFGEDGPGSGPGRELPVIGAVHLAAGYLIQEMLGCRVEYSADTAPQVIPAHQDKMDVNPDQALQSEPFRRLLQLMEALKSKYGYLIGDVNWSGILNIALDLMGQNVLTEMYLNPDEIRTQFSLIADVITRFTDTIRQATGTTSVSVNRNIRHIELPVFLHSECSHTMIPTEQYEEFLMPFDLAWSQKNRPFGIHYCGPDPHRYAESFANIPTLDFLDVGWGGDVAMLRKHLPTTFLNIRLDPVTLKNYSDKELENTITRLVNKSGNLRLTGLCCINMDDSVPDETIRTIYRVAGELRGMLFDNRFGGY